MIIIDCTFKENGEWVLIDYKTDHDKIVRSFLLKVPGREPFFMLVPKSSDPYFTLCNHR